MDVFLATVVLLGQLRQFFYASWAPLPDRTALRECSVFRRIKLFDETTEHLLRIADSSYFHLDRHKLRPKDAVYDDP